VPAAHDAPTATVVGAGVFGAAVADALARRGWAVTIVEQFSSANARGSSGDRTRLLRHGHGDGPAEADLHYIRSAARGIALWHQIAESEGVELTQRTGLVWLAREPAEVELRVAARLTDAGIAHDRLEVDEVRKLFPDVSVDDLAFGLWEPEAWVIRAGLAVETLMARARRHGAQLILDRAVPAGDGAVQLLAGERRLGSDVVVWACGAWLGRLLPADAPVRPSWQDVLHWSTPPAWRDGPAWFDEREGLYGFPDVDGLGAKAVSHIPGPDFDLERDARSPRAQSVEDMTSYMARRFPALAGSGLLWARVMPYEMTPDHHFVVGRSELGDHTWLLGGGSGHGFKHAPALGEHLADLIEERDTPVAMWAPGPRRAVPAPATT